MSEPDPGAAQLGLPFAGDRNTSALERIAASRTRGRGGRARSSSPQPMPRCGHCGKPVKVPKWLLAQGLENHYCNDECRRAWARADVEDGRGHEGVELKPLTNRHRGANWGVQSRKARERDRYACRVCGLSEEELGRRLHVHHTIPFGRFRSNVEANRLEHLVSVCPSCHAHLEAQLRRELPLFADNEPAGANRRVRRGAEGGKGAVRGG